MRAGTINHRFSDNTMSGWILCERKRSWHCSPGLRHGVKSRPWSRRSCGRADVVKVTGHDEVLVGEQDH